MKEQLKRWIELCPIYYRWRNWKTKQQQDEELRQWEARGKTAPDPHRIKQKTLREYAQRYNLKVLVETGTFKGDMVEAMKNDFVRIFTIELSRPLAERAQRRFRKYPHISVICGDSGKEIAAILQQIDQPALFWLDGHYSGGITACGDKVTPIFEELKHLFQTRTLRHVLIIDDARLFGTDSTYPTLPELTEFIRSKVDNVDITVQNDSIRVTPKP